jgi:protein-disulfide isomerase
MRHTSGQLRLNWKTALDSAATVAVIVACGSLTWATLRSGSAPGRPKPTQESVPLPSTSVPLSGATIKGSMTAPVAIIEYSDFQCPYCAVFATKIAPDINKEFVSTNRVLIAFRHLPLASIHSLATRAAQGAICAGQQGKFWEMHDLLFLNQKNLREAMIASAVASLVLDSNRFAECMDSHVTLQISRDALGAAALGISGTPTFLVGLTQKDGTVTVKHRFAGAKPLPFFREVLNALLTDAAEPRARAAVGPATR